MAWIFFRADTYGDAIYVLKNLFLFQDGFQLNEIGMGKQDFILAVVLIAIFCIAEIIEEYCNIHLRSLFYKFPYAVRVCAYVFVLMFVILFGMYGDLSANSFIYVQF